MGYQSAVIYTSGESIHENKACFGKIIFRIIMLLMIVFPLIYTLFRYMSAPLNVGAGNQYVLMPLSSLPAGSAKLVSYNAKPVIVINSNGNVKALSGVCTLTDSILHWDNEREELLCTVHGARFDLHGNVKAGLAPRPLDRFKVIVTEDTIIIGGQV